MIEKQQEGAKEQVKFYDKEWIELIIEAKQIGLDIHDIQKFLSESKTTVHM